MIAAIAAIASVPFLDNASALTRFAPYDEGDAFFQSCSGNIGGAYWWDRNVGKMDPYTDLGGSGNCDVVMRMGIHYNPVNGNGMPGFSSYTTTARAAIHAVGRTLCVTGGGSAVDANLALKLELWRWSGSAWQLWNSQDTVTYDCAQQTYWDARPNANALWSFEPGTQYNILVEATAHVHADFAVGISDSKWSDCADFSQFPDCHAGYGIWINSMGADNVAPVGYFPNGHTWYGTALTSGVSSTGQACDHETYLTWIAVHINGASADGSRSSACASSTVHWSASVPGSYDGTASGTDSDGASGTSHGTWSIDIFPSSSNSVQGFPAIDSISATQLGPSVSVETMVKSDGTVRAYRVTSGSTVFYDTMTGVLPDPTDHMITTQYDRLVSQATIKKDNVQQWSGAVVQVDTSWWHIKPVSDTTLPGQDPPAGTPPSTTPPANDTYPTSDSGTL